MGGGVCQALFFGWQTDTDADADVYCIYTIYIYRRGGGGFRSWDFLSWLSGWTVGGCRCFGAKVREQVLVFCSYGVKVRKQVLEKKCVGVETPFTYPENGLYI